jgi:hypothetical protein
MIQTTQYYDEYLRYFNLALDQQKKCNVSSEAPYGMIKHLESDVGDDLMHHVELYDVVERKFAGFSQIVNDAFYGWTDQHPYWHKMQAGNVTHQRITVANDWTGKHSDFSLPEWLYIFILHRVCGSAINYATKPSGYHNTLLFSLHNCKTIEDMIEMVNTYQYSFYTSVGYQFPAFPKPPSESKYKRGGDYYLSEYAPRLARELAEFLERGGQRSLREIGSFMLDWNVKNDLRQYHFQYAAVVADIADWYPQYVDKSSPFYYGTNAVECISYLAKPVSKMKQEEFLDQVMEKIYEDTGAYPYNAEDVCCDFIRWVENYVRPGADYNHLNFDDVWSSCRIKDHPFGRQEAMLKLGLIDTFNNITAHPSDDTILKANNMTVQQYKDLCKTL